MGTNYYVASKHSESCDRYDKEYHIGKSSWGWSFYFQGYRPEGLVSWRDWKEFLRNKTIMDEYGKHIDYDWFVNFVEGVKSPGYYRGDGHRNLQHNAEGRKPDGSGLTWYNAEFDWDDPEGYAFCSREFC